MRLRINRQMMSGVTIGDGAIFWYYGYLCATPVPRMAPQSGFTLGIVYLPRDHFAREQTDILARRVRVWLHRVAGAFKHAGLSLESFDNVLLVRVSITELAKSWWIGTCAPDRYWRAAMTESRAKETYYMYRNMEAAIGRVCFEIQKLEEEMREVSGPR